MSYCLTSIHVTSGISLSAHIWTPPQEPIALIHIFHGMMEHGGRYKEFAKFCNDHGIIVVSHDHRGHGQTGERETGLGCLGAKATWKTVINDCYDCHLFFKEKYPNIPFILLGHSMGSFLALQTVRLHNTSFQGVLLSGSTYEPPSKMIGAYLLATVFTFFFGAQSKATLIHSIIFGGYNNRFPEAKTPSDWLSRDPFAVSSYLADPFCGQICSLGFYRELFSCLISLFKPKSLDSVRSELPFYLFSGTNDPVGDFGAGFNNLIDFLREEGLTELTTTLYDEGRHVMLQETNREDVFNDIYQWINYQFL